MDLLLIGIHPDTLPVQGDKSIHGITIRVRFSPVWIF